MSSLILPGRTLLSAVTAITVSPAPNIVCTSGLQNIDIEFTGANTISGGTIAIEESSDDTYTGAWSAMPFYQGTSVFPASLLTGNAKVVVHLKVGVGLFIQVRVTGTITGGGSVTAGLAG